MSEVLIITKIGKNYGAILQAFALKSYIETMGHKAGIIYYAHRKSQSTYHVLTFGRSKKAALRSFRNLYHYRAIRRSVSRFYAFRRDFFGLTKLYESLEHLRNDPPYADIYITGSDQVWNPMLRFDAAYFLDFGLDDTIRASYAASVGLEELPGEYATTFTQCLKKIDFLSVREHQAKVLLHRLGYDATVCLDPTLLHPHTFYSKIAVSPYVNEPYILCYLMSMPSHTKKVLSFLKKNLGYTIVNIARDSTAHELGDIQIWDAGPCEFLGLFAHADFVITSSFHGTAFSVIYQKPFWVMPHSQTSSRVTGLLEQLSLEDRIVHEDDSLTTSMFQIDYTETNRLLENLILDSRNYLQSVFSFKKGDQ